MTKDDRNLMRAMFMILFWMLWNMVALQLGTEVEVEKWDKLMKKALSISKKEE